MAELSAIQESIDENEMAALENEIKSARAVFVTGAGRSLLMMKAFAMRLMQIGLTAYVVGETVTPAITGMDLLVIGSGSGEKQSLVLTAKTAAECGAAVACITGVPFSRITGYSRTVLTIPVPVKPAQPGGGVFEQSLLLACDRIIMDLIDGGSVNADLTALHANLE